MAHLVQVGAGSGGMPVLDMVCRDRAVTAVTLIEPDVYKSHNVERHLFPPSAVGERKAVLAERWLKERRPDLEVRLLVCDLMDPERQGDIDEAAAAADLGVCARRQRAGQNTTGTLSCAGTTSRGPSAKCSAAASGGFVHWFTPAALVTAVWPAIYNALSWWTTLRRPTTLTPAAR